MLLELLKPYLSRGMNTYAAAAMRQAALCGAGQRLLVQQKAFLTPTRGQKRPKEFVDWPYMKWNYYAPLCHWLDNTRKRVTYDSKIVCVEGSLAAGKTKFAERFAREFDFLHIPDYQDDTFFKSPLYGFDLRQLNFQLSPEATIWDREQFFMHPDRIGKGLWLQFWAYLRMRFKSQGVVLDRSFYTDFAFADAMYKMGFWDKAGYDWFCQAYQRVSGALWKPHLFIYIDVPVDVALERIKKRNVPWEVNSKVINRRFLELMEESMKEKLFPFAREHGELLVYKHDDFESDAHWESILDDVDALELEGDPAGTFEKHQFRDWAKPYENEWNQYRSLVQSNYLYTAPFCAQPCWEHPESFYQCANLYDLQENLFSHPLSGMSLAPGWDAAVNKANPQLGFKHISLSVLDKNNGARNQKSSFFSHRSVFH